jgi:hypothetical protein
LSKFILNPLQIYFYSNKTIKIIASNDKK